MPSQAKDDTKILRKACQAEIKDIWLKLYAILIYSNQTPFTLPHSN